MLPNPHDPWWRDEDYDEADVGEMLLDAFFNTLLVAGVILFVWMCWLAFFTLYFF